MSDCIITKEQSNEYIKRGDAMTCEISVSALREDKTVIEQVVEGIMDHIKNVPSADVVEVVRCKNCKWWKREERTCKVMAITSPSSEWYCGSGVRNREEQEHD